MNNTKKLTLFSLLLACALIFSFVESLFPLDFIAPGIKIGLANSVCLLLICAKHYKTAAFVNFCRIILSCLLFSNPLSLIYALSGAVLSYIIMLFATKIKLLGIIGVSVLGAVFHNLAQITAAFFIVESTGIFYYLPILLISGIICGILTGVCTSAILKNKNIQKFVIK